MKRTLLTTGLIAVLLLAASFPASAVSMETLPDSAADTVKGITETPGNTGAEIAIDTQVPENAEFILNPYQMSVDTPSGSTQDAVISEPQTIISRTPVPLLAMVSATGTVYGEASFAVSPEDFDPATKSAFLWIEFQNVTDGEEPVWSGEYTGTRNQVVLNGESRPVLELPASGDGEPVQAVFRIFGAVGVPSEGMWTVDDGVDVSLSFEFEVIEDDEATLYSKMFADTPPEVSDIAEPVEDVESFDVAEPVEDEEPADVEEPVDDVELSDVIEPVDDVEASDNEEPVEDEEPADVAEPVDDVELSDNEEPVEDEEPADDVEPADVAEPVEDA